MSSKSKKEIVKVEEVKVEETVAPEVVEETKVEEVITPKVVEEKIAKDVNAAIAYKGKREVRRYTLEIHGKDFISLAKRYADSKDVRLEFKNVKPGLVCEACGHVNYSA